MLYIDQSDPVIFEGGAFEKAVQMSEALASSIPHLMDGTFLVHNLLSHTPLLGLCRTNTLKKYCIY